MLIYDSNGRFGGEGHFAGHHFIHHDAERIKVAAPIDFSALRLFGTEIKHRSNGFVRHCERFRLRYFGNAEVRHFDKAAFEKHNVLGLYVAVDYVL